MSELAPFNLAAERERIERHAATQLGLMLFEYSRLEMELGLHIVWADEGKTLDELTDRLKDSAINKRLLFLQQYVARKYADGGEAVSAYAAWLQEAHEVRALRNDFVHGRWGPWGRGHGVRNVVGMPTSSEQREVCYTPEQLEQIVQRIKDLRSEHARLRGIWPV